MSDHGEAYHGPAPVHAAGAYWEPYTDEQYKSLARLTTALLAKYPIKHITGHSDIAVPKGRKIDPGRFRLPARQATSAEELHGPDWTAVGAAPLGFGRMARNLLASPQVWNIIRVFRASTVLLSSLANGQISQSAQ